MEAHGAQGREEYPAKGERQFGLQAAIWLPAVVTVYLLSLGPMARLEQRGVVSMDAINVIYAPVKVLAEHSVFVQNLVRWYVLDVWHRLDKAS